MATGILDAHGRRVRPMHWKRDAVRAKYDAAQTTKDNSRHWANADAYSADAAMSASVRRILRNRARYEVANNSYARGIVNTLANDCIGTGPRLQMLSDDPAVNAQIEVAFHEWARTVRLAEKLRTMRKAWAQDGEAFGLPVNDERVAHPVKLNLALVEADQVANPTFNLASADTDTDGIALDGYGNPVTYRILRNHPGSTAWATAQDYNDYDANQVIHLFRQERPGQHRGIPEITPALPLFAQLRRFTLAVLFAAEAAADFAGILYTDAPADDENEPVEPLDTFELERNMLLTMPQGWKMAQVKSEQPATTYADFKREIINEIARCLNMPYNVAAGNSAGYNYASGRLDHQVYFKSVAVDQSFVESIVLDHVLRQWLAEAMFVPDLIPASFMWSLVTPMPRHEWFWDGAEHVDPSKEATAQETRLRNNTTTLAAEYAKQGKDWEAEIKQRGREVALLKELNLLAAPVSPAADNATQDEEDTSDGSRE